MAGNITQCPKCLTSFRVSEAQLTIASGKVRCGSCLHIFFAPEHWLGNHQAVTATPPAEPAPSTDHRQDLADQTAVDTEQQASVEPPAPEIDADTDTIEADSVATNSTATDSAETATDGAEDEAEADIFDADVFGTDHADNFELSMDDLLNADEDLDNLIDEAYEEMGSAAEPSPAPRANEPDLAAADEETPADDTVWLSDDPLSDNLEEATDTASSATPTPTQVSEQRFGDDDDSDTDEDTDSASVNHWRSNREPERRSLISQSLLTDDDFTSSDDNDEFNDSFLNFEDSHRTGFKDLDELSASDDNEDNWAEQLLQEDAASAQEEPEQETEEDTIEFPEFPDLLDQVDEIASDDAELQDILNQRDETRRSQRRPTPAAASSAAEETEFLLDESLTAGERIGTDSRKRLLANFEPEPVEFASRDRRQQWVDRAWQAGLVLAVLALVGQYLFFNFDRLARDPNYRSLLAQGCALLPCDIPELHDIRLIRASNLVVRSHPQAAQALVVDAIITNRASFQQPFPDLELQFTDLRGQLVASRRFKASEYLAGELTGITVMPIKQPVHISLAIVDPGSEAINYQLHFHPGDS